MEGTVGLDVRVKHAGEGKIGARLRGNDRLQVGNVKVGCFNVRMQHGVRVKYRLAPGSPRRRIERTAESDTHGTALELRMLDSDLRRRNRS